MSSPEEVRRRRDRQRAERAQRIRRGPANAECDAPIRARFQGLLLERGYSLFLSFITGFLMRLYRLAWA